MDEPIVNKRAKLLIITLIYDSSFFLRAQLLAAYFGESTQIVYLRSFTTEIFPNNLPKNHLPDLFTSFFVIGYLQEVYLLPNIS